MKKLEEFCNIMTSIKIIKDIKSDNIFGSFNACLLEGNKKYIFKTTNYFKLRVILQPFTKYIIDRIFSRRIF